MGKTGPGIPGKRGQEGGSGQLVLFAPINLTKQDEEIFLLPYPCILQKGLISLSPIPKGLLGGPACPLTHFGPQFSEL